MRRPVIFLDIDGVLNSTEFLSRREGPISSWRQKIDRRCAERINRICQRTNAKIVISSSTRKFNSFLELRRNLRWAGISADIVGFTPYSNRFRPCWGKGAKSKLTMNSTRGDEIGAWLSSHVVDQFVILDDDRDMGPLIPNLVRINPEIGITDADVERSIAMLTHVHNSSCDAK